MRHLHWHFIVCAALYQSFPQLQPHLSSSPCHPPPSPPTHTSFPHASRCTVPIADIVAQRAAPVVLTPQDPVGSSSLYSYFMADRVVCALRAMWEGDGPDAPPGPRPRQWGWSTVVEAPPPPPPRPPSHVVPHTPTVSMDALLQTHWGRE